MPRLTLRANLQYWARLQGIPRRRRIDNIARARARALALALALALAERAGERIEHCSGETLRRLNLAVALLGGLVLAATPFHQRLAGRVRSLPSPTRPLAGMSRPQRCSIGAALISERRDDT